MARKRGPVRNKAAGKLRPFAWDSAALLAGPLQRAFGSNVRYLHSLVPDRHLWTFRVTAGLPTLARRFAKRAFVHPLAEGKDSVTVRFQPAPNGQAAGGVFGLSTLRKETTT